MMAVCRAFSFKGGLLRTLSTSPPKFWGGGVAKSDGNTVSVGFSWVGKERGGGSTKRGAYKGKRPVCSL